MAILKMFDVSAVSQVLLLAKNARGLTSVIDLVSDALTRTDLFVFAELIDLPIVQQLKEETGFKPWYAALELFAYGTWKEYMRDTSPFPELSSEQQLKLKQLTTVNMAQTKHVLSYEELKTELDFQETRDLEDFLINSCFYAKILKGKLNQAQGLLIVQDSINRDVRFEDLPHIKAKLRSWFESSERTLYDILGRVVFTKEAAERIEIKKRNLAFEAEKRMKEIKDLDGMRMETTDCVHDLFFTTSNEREPKSRRSESDSNF